MSELQALKVVFIEDDDMLRAAACQTFMLAGIPVSDFARAEPALSLLRADAAVVVVTDVRLPGMDGMTLLQRALEIDPDLPVILVTGHGDVTMAVAAMRLGAYDFIEKPFAPERLAGVVERAIEKRRLVLENRALRAQLANADPLAAMVGDSAPMREVRRLIVDLGDADVDVLVQGDTGTGKERVARGLHAASRRKGNFVAINCAALPESVFESEMFGVEPGAFTGATRSRAGKIEHAGGGTLFLDEIEGMALPLQAKLLRVLQERVVERLGSNRLVPVDCRIVAATKLDLAAEAAAGRFRLDLYYRLNVVSIALPRLRERSEDIPQLFSVFMLQAAERYKRTPPEPSAEMFDWLMAQDWPGNVRELQHMADRYVLGVWRPEVETTLGGPSGLVQRVAGFELSLIEATLERCGGDVSASAEALSVPRKTLYDKITKYRIDVARFRAATTSPPATG